MPVVVAINRFITDTDNELKTHCQEILDLLKSKVDDDIFSQHYMEIQMNLAKQKGERAVTKKQNLVLNIILLVLLFLGSGSVLK